MSSMSNKRLCRKETPYRLSNWSFSRWFWFVICFHSCLSKMAVIFALPILLVRDNKLWQSYCHADFHWCVLFPILECKANLNIFKNLHRPNYPSVLSLFWQQNFQNDIAIFQVKNGISYKITIYFSKWQNLGDYRANYQKLSTLC